MSTTDDTNAAAGGSRLERGVRPFAWLCEWEHYRTTYVEPDDPLPDDWNGDPPLRITALFTETQAAALAAMRRKVPRFRLYGGMWHLVMPNQTVWFGETIRMAWLRWEVYARSGETYRGPQPQVPEREPITPRGWTRNERGELVAPDEFAAESAPHQDSSNLG